MNIRREPDGEWSEYKKRKFEDGMNELFSSEILCRLVEKKRRHHAYLIEECEKLLN